MDYLLCAQLNTHHSKAAMAHLSLYAAEKKADIMFIQEPYCYDGKPCYIPTGYQCFHAPSDTNPRASLLIRKEIAHNFMLLQQFLNSDNTIVLVTTNPQIYIVSSYLPPYDTLEQDLKAIETFITSVKPTNLIWGLDANSKHSIWFSPTTDKRGKTLVNFLALHGLITVNEKDGPTYCGPTGVSWIDITATTIKAAHKVQNWRISEECTQSDHNLIEFQYRIQPHKHNLNRVDGEYTRKYATQVGKWNQFQAKIKMWNKQWRVWIQDAKTKEELDNAITGIWNGLVEASRECFPHFRPKAKYNPRWSPHLTTLRKKVNALKRRVKRSKTKLSKRYIWRDSQPSNTNTDHNYYKPNRNPGGTTVRSAPEERPGKYTRHAKQVSPRRKSPPH